MKNKLQLLVVIGVLLSQGVFAQSPVWSTDVAPILYNHCTTCHHTGGLHFPLVSYQDAYGNAGGIQAAVQNNVMPPWPPNPAYSHLAHERLLSQQEITTLVNWVNGGAQEGNPALAPPAPVYNNNGSIPGTPDYAGQIPAYTSPATINTGDMYRCFVIPSNLLTDKFITAFECIPGNPSIVHHVLVYADTSGVCRHLDSLDPGPGYTDFGGVGSNSAVLIGSWVPGSGPIIYPSGFGVQLLAHSDIVLQIHYPAGTAGQVDSTMVHFFFSATNSVRNLYIEPVLNYLSNIDTAIFIPANTTRTFTEQYYVPLDFSVLGVAPHMHNVGKEIHSFGLSPQGDTDKFISIPKWDFHWQGFYMFPKIRKVVAGSTIYASAFYDNTTNNPTNPNYPPQDVYAGENTTDEMMLVYFIFTPYQAGDENIIIDSTEATGIIPYSYSYYHGQQLFDPYPNPSSENVFVKCYFADADNAGIDLLNTEGKVVQQFASNEHMANGYSVHNYSLHNLPDGIYSIRVTTSQRILTRQLVIRH